MPAAEKIPTVFSIFSSTRRSVMKMRFSLLVPLFTILFIGCTTQPSSPPTKVLFIGSSMIYTNDMPGMFKETALSMKQNILVESSTAPGYNLNKHLQSDETLSKIKSQKWDYVIILPHTVTLINEERREKELIPNIRKIKTLIEENGSQMYILTNSAFKRGYMIRGADSFTSMQKLMIESLDKISTMENVQRIPMGDAWLAYHGKHKETNLWARDAEKPNPAGTFLSVQLLYQYIFGEAPSEDAYIPPMVDAGTARSIRNFIQNS